MPLRDEDEDDRAEELDERSRQQYLAILQFLQSKELFETLTAMESETGLKCEDGDLPLAAVLETSLDMFARYRAEEKAPDAGEKDAAREAEEELQRLERGACCTG